MSAAMVRRDLLAPFRQPVDAVLAEFGTDACLGLSERKERGRLARYGKNELLAGRQSRHGGNSSENACCVRLWLRGQ
jgi:Cation transporter/ATPase, N-terminus